MSKVLKADSSAADAWVQTPFTLGGTFWLTFRFAYDSAALALWMAGNAAGAIAALRGSPAAIDRANTLLDGGFYNGTGWTSIGISGDTTTTGTIPDPDVWHIGELNYEAGVIMEFFVDGVSQHSFAGPAGNANKALFGLYSTIVGDPAAVIYIDDVKIGTTRGGSDIFSDDFEDGTFNAWDSVTGDCSIVDDPFPAAGCVPNSTAIRPVVWPVHHP